MNFPTTSDTHYAPSGDNTYMWNYGDYVQGTRSTSLTSTSRADIYLVIGTNYLSCDTQDASFRINGIAVGSFSITGSSSSISRTFTFGAIPGPTYTLQYFTTRTVSGGCGSASYNDYSSTVTLYPP